ncbi:MAG: hypothetical protein V1787_02030 [Candidatus Micrarchaeota archaeon]
MNPRRHAEKNRNLPTDADRYSALFRPEGEFRGIYRSTGRPVWFVKDLSANPHDSLKLDPFEIDARLERMRAGAGLSRKDAWERLRDKPTGIEARKKAVEAAIAYARFYDSLKAGRRAGESRIGFHPKTVFAVANAEDGRSTTVVGIMPKLGRRAKLNGENLSEYKRSLAAKVNEVLELEGEGRQPNADVGKTENFWTAGKKVFYIDMNVFPPITPKLTKAVLEWNKRQKK